MKNKNIKRYLSIGILLFTMTFLFSACSGTTEELKQNLNTKEELKKDTGDSTALSGEAKSLTEALEKKTQKSTEQNTSVNKNNNIKNMNEEKEVIKDIDMSLAKTCQQATLQTNFGDIVIKFYREKAPVTVANFCTLAKKGFYNGVKFHRVIDGFMIQAGDPNSKDDSKKDLWGTGGPGYKFADELPMAGEYKIGSVAMANSGKDTNGSQFFIVSGPAGVGLPPQYSLFGEVVQGLDVVKKIQEVETEEKGLKDRPVSPVVIKNVKLVIKK
jgi:cyclophilin family peptidyl-prolyl cis-trans isomerase